MIGGCEGISLVVDVDGGFGSGWWYCVGAGSEQSR